MLRRLSYPPIVSYTEPSGFFVAYPLASAYQIVTPKPYRMYCVATQRLIQSLKVSSYRSIPDLLIYDQRMIDDAENRPYRPVPMPSAVVKINRSNCHEEVHASFLQLHTKPCITSLPHNSSSKNSSTTVVSFLLPYLDTLDLHFRLRPCWQPLFPGIPKVSPSCR